MRKLLKLVLFKLLLLSMTIVASTPTLKGHHENHRRIHLHNIHRSCILGVDSLCNRAHLQYRY